METSEILKTHKNLSIRKNSVFTCLKRLFCNSLRLPLDLKTCKDKHDFVNVRTPHGNELDYFICMVSQVFPRIFEYDDYRRFLEDFFQEQKKMRATFSHRFFARKAGFTSSSFCLSVIKGRFNLSHVATEKVLKALELDNRQSSFFTALVQYNQAKQATEREDAWMKIQELRRAVEFQGLAVPQHGYFSHWYYPVLRELITHPQWKGDFIQLARWVTPTLSTEVARAAVQDLLDWGIVIKDPQGRYVASSPLIHGEGVPPMSLRQIRREYLQNGIGALDALPPSQRFATFTTLAMSENTYDYTLRVLDDARRKIIARAAGDAKVEKVYEMVLQLFPLTKRISGDES